MSEENGQKKEVLRTIILLLVGFMLGFATHAYVAVTETADDEVADTTINKPTGEDEEENEASTTSDNPTMSNNDMTEVNHTFNAIPNNTATDNFSISVTDQSAGDMVYVSQMDLGAPAWVAIRENNDGELGNILGAGWYPEGKSTGTVELLRGTESGAVYYVVLYTDNGDKQFDYRQDTLVTDGGTNILVTKFRTY